MNRDFFLARWEAEGAGTLHVMQAIPEDKSDYRPDPKARTAKELAALLNGEAFAMTKLIDVGEFDLQPARPPKVAEIATDYEKAHAGIAQRVKGLDDAAWDKKAKFSVMGRTVFDMPLGQILWALLFDGIHHRGQLSTYLRPMGSKVPSIYGPSADSAGGH